MKLWKIEWDQAYPDETGLVIIRAETSEDAVEMAKQDMFYYHSDTHKYKFDISKWTIEELTTDGPAEIVGQR